MRLKEKSTGRISEIELTSDKYPGDWSQDFFNTGELEYDEDDDAYIVNSIEYCIEQATDWANDAGDYDSEEEPDNDVKYVYVDGVNVVRYIR